MNEINVILDESIKIRRILSKESIKKIENDLEEKININELIKSQEFEKLENELSNKKKEIDLNTENEIKKLKMKIDDVLYNKNRKTQWKIIFLYTNNFLLKYKNWCYIW